MRRRRIISAVMAAIVVGGAGAGCAVSGAAGGGIAAAQQAIDEGRSAEAIGILRECGAGEGKADQDPRGSYLLGLAIFKETDAELSRLRGQKLQRPDLLEPGQVEQLRECLAHLTRAVEIAPEAGFAPDAAYLAARVQDWGYLRRTDAARQAYRAVVERYPGTEAAGKASDRIKYWDNLFKHYRVETESDATKHQVN